MNVPLKHFIRPGLVVHVAYQRKAQGIGILQCLEDVAKDTFFEVAELAAMESSAIRQRAREILVCSGLSAAYGGQGLTLGAGLSLSDLDESRSHQAVEAIKYGIDEAVELGALHCQFMSGTYDPAHKEEAFQALLQSTEEICTYAEKKNMPLVCELFDYDVDKKALIGPSRLAARYAKIVRERHKQFGLQLDLSHIPLQHETSERSVAEVRPYLTHVHVGNAVCEEGQTCYGDMHPRFGFPHSANGIAELAQFLRTLLDTQYLSDNKRQIVSFEIRPWEGEKASLVIANAKRALEAAWQLV